MNKECKDWSSEMLKKLNLHDLMNGGLRKSKAKLRFYFLL